MLTARTRKSMIRLLGNLEWELQNSQLEPEDERELATLVLDLERIHDRTYFEEYGIPYERQKNKLDTRNRIKER